MKDRCVSHESPVALLLVDVINDLEFDTARRMDESVLSMARNVASLKREARRHGIPCLYVNDNFGQWQSDFRRLVRRCIRAGSPGASLTRILLPRPEDYFVLKPRHSGFFQTPLELLLRYLHARILIICGLTTDSCVLFTANDAHLRGLQTLVPADCCAALTPGRHREALRQMRRTIGADTGAASRIDFDRLLC